MGRIKKQVKRGRKKKKIKEVSTAAASISYTVAHTAIFKPDAGLPELREGLTEWEEKSGSWEKRGSPGEMWSELSSVRKWLLGSCQVRSQAGAFECLCESVCENRPSFH